MSDEYVSPFQGDPNYRDTLRPARVQVFGHDSEKLHGKLTLMEEFVSYGVTVTVFIGDMTVTITQDQSGWLPEMDHIYVHAYRDDNPNRDIHVLERIKDEFDVAIHVGDRVSYEFDTRTELEVHQAMAAMTYEQKARQELDQQKRWISSSRPEFVP